MRFSEAATRKRATSSFATCVTPEQEKTLPTLKEVENAFATCAYEVLNGLQTAVGGLDLMARSAVYPPRKTVTDRLIEAEAAHTKYNKCMGELLKYRKPSANPAETASAYRFFLEALILSREHPEWKGNAGTISEDGILPYADVFKHLPGRCLKPIIHSRKNL